MQFPVKLTKKRIIWSLIILLVGGPIVYKIVKGSDPAAGILTEIVKKQDLKRTVLATGQVVSETDLSLSFRVSGIVSRVNVKEGGKVKAGEILAILDQKDQIASLTTARGSLAAAEANYKKVLSGASVEDVAVAQVTLDNAKIVLANTLKQQQVLVDNAYSALLNTGLEAIAEGGNSGSVTATVSGTYVGREQGIYKITIYSSGSGLRFQVNGLETSDGLVDITPKPMGSRGLYIQFSSTSVPVNNSWVVAVPNSKASSYVANYNAYYSALETQRSNVTSAQNSVTSAQAALDFKKAQARPADLEAVNAQVLSAQGQLQAAQAALENTIIRAPADGTITRVEVKVGELSTALKEALVLQDVGNLHAEANVSEANIALLKTGQAVDITLDALGSDRNFTGTVQTVNPGADIISGVVNYKVTVKIDNIPEIKPGMTVNITVLVQEKQNVLAVPQRAVIQNGGKKVRVVNNAKTKTYDEVKITTGLEADGGLIEVLSGINEGQEIITFIKK